MPDANTVNPRDTRIAMLDDGSYDVPDHAIERAWERRVLRMEQSRNRILDCADIRHGRIAVAAPETVNTDEGDEESWWAARDPERLTLESRQVQTYADNEITLERRPLGTNDQAIEDADQAALWTNSVVRELVPKRTLWGKAVEDGEWGVICEPRTLGYFETPEPMDLLTEDEWQALADDEREDWTPGESETTDPKTSLITKQSVRKRFKRDYWRDAKGRAPDHALYKFASAPPFARDEQQTSKAHADAVLAHLCERFPVSCRVISALDCIPYLVEGTGKDRFECRGLLVRKLYEMEDLTYTHGYQWTDMDTMAIPVGYDAKNTTGAYGMPYLYEAWVYIYNPKTGEQDPCVVMSVAGRQTWSERDDDCKPVIKNLRDEYGLTKLPIWYGWGMHTESDDPDLRGIPYLHPIAQTIINREGLKTSYLAHINRYAFGKLAVIPDPKIPAAAYMQGDVLRDFNDQEGDLVTLPGPVMPLVQPPVLQGVKDLISLFSLDISENTADPSTAGQGGGDRSGHSLTVSKSFQLAAASDTMKSVAECVRWIGETTLEIADKLGAKFNLQVPTWVEDELPVSAEDQTTQVMLELNPRWLKGNYKLKAIYETPGNLSEVEEEASLAARGFATKEDVLRKRGKKSPQTEIVKIAADRFRDSPEGQAMLLSAVFRRRGDIERAKTLELQLQGALTKAGVPTDALDPAVRPGATPRMAPGGAGVGQGMPNQGPTSLGNPVQNSVNATIGGATEAAARQSDAAATVGAAIPGAA